MFFYRDCIANHRLTNKNYCDGLIALTCPVEMICYWHRLNLSHINLITRLLYVAATRAKKSLHLFACVEAEGERIKPPKQGSFLDKLWPVVEVACQSLSKTTSKNTAALLPRENNLFYRLSSEWKPTFTVSETAEKPDVKIDMTLYSQTARMIGTVIHETLQLLSENTCDAFSIPQCRSRLFSLGILPHEIDESLETVKSAIENTLNDPQGQWILHQHQQAKSEWSLTQVIQSEVQQVIIDRTFIENNTRWIIDYKTTTPKENENTNDFLERQKQEHQAQLENYANILAQTENRPIKLGLYFPLCAKWMSWDYKT